MLSACDTATTAIAIAGPRVSTMPHSSSFVLAFLGHMNAQHTYGTLLYDYYLLARFSLMYVVL